MSTMGPTWAQRWSERAGGEGFTKEARQRRDYGAAGRKANDDNPFAEEVNVEMLRGPGRPSRPATCTGRDLKAVRKRQTAPVSMLEPQPDLPGWFTFSKPVSLQQGREFEASRGGNSTGQPFPAPAERAAAIPRTPRPFQCVQPLDRVTSPAPVQRSAVSGWDEPDSPKSTNPLPLPLPHRMPAPLAEGPPAHPHTAPRQAVLPQVCPRAAHEPAQLHVQMRRPGGQVQAAHCGSWDHLVNQAFSPPPALYGRKRVVSLQQEPSDIPSESKAEPCWDHYSGASVRGTASPGRGGKRITVSADMTLTTGPHQHPTAAGSDESKLAVVLEETHNHAVGERLWACELCKAVFVGGEKDATEHMESHFHGADILYVSAEGAPGPSMPPAYSILDELLPVEVIACPVDTATSQLLDLDAPAKQTEQNDSSSFLDKILAGLSIRGHAGADASEPLIEELDVAPLQSDGAG